MDRYPTADSMQTRGTWNEIVLEAIPLRTLFACTEADFNLADVSDIFIFFCSGRGKGESEAPGGRGIHFLLKIPGGGGVFRRGTRGAGGCLRGIWGEGGGA